MKKTVVSLVGMIGAGKTTLLDELVKDGYETLPEGYISNQGYFFDNRLILSQWRWIAEWFGKVATFFDENKEKSYVFVDSCAIISGIWTSHCHSLLAPIQESFNELKKMSFEFINVEIYCEKEILFKRIDNRLKIEPIRLQYNEDNKEFINELYEQYRKNTYLWDYQLDSTNKTPQELKIELLEFLQKKIEIDK